MNYKTIAKLCCPFDKADLNLTSITTNAEGDDVLEGFFTCTTCKRIYPIVKGVPIMTPDDYRERSLEQPLYDKWQKQLENKRIEDFRLLKP